MFNLPPPDLLRIAEASFPTIPWHQSEHLLLRTSDSFFRIRIELTAFGFCFGRSSVYPELDSDQLRISDHLGADGFVAEKSKSSSKRWTKTAVSTAGDSMLERLRSASSSVKRKVAVQPSVTVAWTQQPPEATTSGGMTAEGTRAEGEQEDVRLHSKQLQKALQGTQPGGKDDVHL